ncbi:MAG TPA: hypothetical protein VMT15_10610 [Bryobacteraceae bacterium]|nr:hypothetical protein [Bryobacteraceae bacterium]
MPSDESGSAQIGRNGLRVAAEIAVVAGAAASLGLMLLVGHRNPSALLLTLFGGWVLLPFVGLLVAAKRGRGSMVSVLILIVALASVGIYAYAAFGPPLAKPHSRSWRFLSCLGWRSPRR